MPPKASKRPALFPQGHLRPPGHVDLVQAVDSHFPTQGAGMPPGKGRQSRGCSPLGQAQGISLVTTQNPQRAKRGHPRGRTLRENGNRPTRCDRPAEYNCSKTSQRTHTDPPAKPTRKWTEQGSPRMEKRKGRRTWRHRANFRRSIAAIRSSRTCIRLVPKKRATFE